MRVIRVLIYEGDERWIKATLEASLLGTREIIDGCFITSVAVKEIPTQSSWRPWLRDKYPDIDAGKEVK